MTVAQDDQPTAVEGASVSIQVDEHFHRHGWFDFFFDHFDDTRFTIAQLQGLVDAGADGPAQFALDTSISGPVKTTDGTIATSHGVQIDFAAAGHRIIGFADTDGDGSRDPGEHVVFRLVDEGNRGFDFDLKGEVDHPASNGGSAAEVLGLDLTHAFSVTDSDGDPVTLAANTIVAELAETTRDEHGPGEHEPGEHDEHGPHDGQHEHGQHEHGQHEDGQDGPGQDEPGQHEGGPNQSTGPLASLLTGLVGEEGHRIFDALADHLTGDKTDDSAHSQTENDVLADLAGQDAFVFNKEFANPVLTHLLAGAGEAFHFLDQLAAHVPPLQAALTEIEARFDKIVNALQEHSPSDASPAAAPHQDNFVL